MKVTPEQQTFKNFQNLNVNEFPEETKFKKVLTKVFPCHLVCKTVLVVDTGCLIIISAYCLFKPGFSID